SPIATTRLVESTTSAKRTTWSERGTCDAVRGPVRNSATSPVTPPVVHSNTSSASTSTYLAPGICSARQRPCTTGTAPFVAECTTSVGTATSQSRSRTSTEPCTSNALTIAVGVALMRSYRAHCSRKCSSAAKLGATNSSDAPVPQAA